MKRSPRLLPAFVVALLTRAPLTRRLSAAADACRGASSRSCRRRPRCSSRWAPATASSASATTTAFRPRSRGCRRSAGCSIPNVERILSLKPDLVIVYDTQTDLKRQLERAQHPDVSATCTAVCPTSRRRCARSARGSARRRAADAAATRIEQQLAAIARRVAGRPRPKTLLVFGREPGSLRHVDASGGYGFLHDMLELAGGADVLGDLQQQSVDMSTEMILARAPEVIIELHYGDALKPERLSTPSGASGTRCASVPAVRNKRVYLLVGDEFVVPGPRIVAGRGAASRATLHPEAFK